MASGDDEHGGTEARRRAVTAVEAIATRPGHVWWAFIAAWLYRFFVPFHVRLSIACDRELARRLAYRAALDEAIERFRARVPGEYYPPEDD